MNRVLRAFTGALVLALTAGILSTAAYGEEAVTTTAPNWCVLDHEHCAENCTLNHEHCISMNCLVDHDHCTGADCTEDHTHCVHNDCTEDHEHCVEAGCMMDHTHCVLSSYTTEEQNVASGETYTHGGCGGNRTYRQSQWSSSYRSGCSGHHGSSCHR